MKALNRIVTALLAIAVFPVAYFTDLITVYMHATIYDSNIVENLSVKRIIELFTGDGLFADLIKGGASELPDGLLKFKGNFIAFVVFFAIALLVALATVIVAAATNSRKATASLGAAGLLSIIGMRIAFSAVSSAAKAGTLGSLTDMSFMNLFGKIVLVTMSTAPAVMTVLFLAILIWNVAFIVIDLGEEQPKKKAKHAKKK